MSGFLRRWRESVQRNDRIQEATVRLYHRTDRADLILRDGFRDGRAPSFPRLLGVWLSNRPLDVNEGPKGDELLAVDVDESSINEYEVIEEGKPYREWCVPASLLNARAVVWVVNENGADG